MAVLLAGGCRVTEMREGAPVVHGTLSIWPQVGRAAGAQAISLRTLEFAPGLSTGIRNRECDEVLYVLEGPGPSEAGATVFIDGWSYEVGTDTGIYLPPDQTLTVNNAGPLSLVLLSSQCPEPAREADTHSAVTSPLAQAARPEKPPLVRLAERRPLPTADRWYRVLVDDEVGSKQVTQFIGSIPPGRAPDHFHTYEEVLFILHGTGRMWAGETNTPISAGSCVYLPGGQVHCVENTGHDELRLLGVFYPAGSPAVRYDV
jgi:mannose-6-phosphate isomerase-like protein (cupin superfamily)